jgi:pimeloyl-ACP methyl ester carboxylesterase
MTALLLALASAYATSGFDPQSPEAIFTGAETMDQAGTQQLWSRIDRYGDPDRTMFDQETYSDLFRWRDVEFTPHMNTLFGAAEPHSSQFLLHYSLNESTATGTPVLFVHGAGDNASRGTFGLRPEFQDADRPFYAITFAHAHGDILTQAEAVANAIEVIKFRTGAAQVDVIAHSKGGLAVTAYASKTPDLDLADDDYELVGTNYRGDIRKMLLISVPLDGIDTAYRWPASNYLGFDEDLAAAPVSWSAHYPMGTGVWWVSQDLEFQDFLPEGGDPFPGQRQLLKRQDHPLPGSMPWLGGYALQTDWWTTYEGGFGLVSHSYGIDAAIDAGGNLVDTLAAQGVDPDIEVILLAGENPLMPSGDPAFEDLWDGLAGPSMWQLLLDSITTWVTPISATSAEVEGLSNGKLILGEVSGPSDGLLFLDSALATQNVTARGAVVSATRVVDISHTELLIASDTFGAVMQSLAGDDPENAWMIDRGQRYIDADTLGWVRDQLADDPFEAEGAQSARGAGEGASLDAVESGWGNMGCSSTGSTGWWMALPALLLFRRR